MSAIIPELRRPNDVPKRIDSWEVLQKFSSPWLRYLGPCEGGLPRDWVFDLMRRNGSQFALEFYLHKFVMFGYKRPNPDEWEFLLALYAGPRPRRHREFRSLLNSEEVRFAMARRMIDIFRATGENETFVPDGYKQIFDKAIDEDNLPMAKDVLDTLSEMIVSAENAEEQAMRSFGILREAEEADYEDVSTLAEVKVQALPEPPEMPESEVLESMTAPADDDAEEA